MKMSIAEKLASEKCWLDFYKYRTEKRKMVPADKKELEDFILEKRYLEYARGFADESIVIPPVCRREISKHSSGKKRTVYLYEGDFLIFLKMLAYLLSEKYDCIFEDNCFAFRRNISPGDAIRRITRTKGIWEKYSLKTDLHDYFNSVPPDKLIEKLTFLKGEDDQALSFFKKMLLSPKVKKGDGMILEDGSCICGIMAGTPTSPFLANVYLMDLDKEFRESRSSYFRYSDDILIFSGSMEELEKKEQLLIEKISGKGLSFNASKRQISAPGESFEFLGFSFKEGSVGLSAHSADKIKGKIRRKARALRRWACRKSLPGEMAAKGFLKAMNRKFYDDGEEGDFSWSRWFFPCLTAAEDLEKIDEYMQKNVRYCVTGRHYKGNYRVTYDKLKEWGYRSLVAEYYSFRESQKMIKNNS